MIYCTAGSIIADYTNHKGERASRRLITKGFYFGSSEWHPEPQWLLEAWDCEKRAWRTFALAGFHAAEPTGAREEPA